MKHDLQNMVELANKIQSDVEHNESDVQALADEVRLMVESFAELEGIDSDGSDVVEVALMLEEVMW